MTDQQITTQTERDADPACRLENLVGPQPVPTCPCCGYAMTTEQMLAHEEDLFAIAPNEAQANIECPACDALYVVQGGYVPQYTSDTDPDW